MTFIRSFFIIVAVALAMAQAAWASRSLADTICYAVSAQATSSIGDHTPLWLVANRHGLSSLRLNNGHLRAAAWRPIEADSARRWGVAWGLDLAAAYCHDATLIVQQAYVEGRWLHGTLTVGSREWPLELKNQRLSSGSQTLGINARPVPAVRLSLSHYWEVPFTGGWVGVKGHIAYGMTTDGNWQADFTHGQSKHTTNTFFHSKAGYLRVGPADALLTLEMGLEMAAQFGGDSYLPVSGRGLQRVANNKSLSSFVNAFIPGGADAVETTYTNSEGNQTGSWVARLTLRQPSWQAAIYADHFFEDHSAMFLLDYDGYGQGPNWNHRTDNRYIMYSLKDMMLGVELTLPRCRWVDAVVAEYVYTKYQSGPIYHDHTSNISDHIGGVDDYYNHYVYSGWQHWGQVMGNPLYLSPIYNDDGTIEVKCNRFAAYHIGLSGHPIGYLSYRLLASWQKGYGRYHYPYANPRTGFSLAAEATYAAPAGSRLDGWSVTAAYGLDAGTLRGQSHGLQITITKSGITALKR